MSIDYSALFTKLGHIFGLQDAAITYEGTTLAGGVDDLSADYASSYGSVWDTASLIQNLPKYQDSLRRYWENLRSLATGLIVQVVDDHQPQENKQIETALRFLARDMATNTETVNSSVVAMSITAGSSNNGNGVAVGSVYRPDGSMLQYAIPETLTALCDYDSLLAGVAEGEERFRVTGAQRVIGSAWNWPVGSGAGYPPRAVSPSTSLLTNGDFELFTVANTPDLWTVVTGTVGTHILNSASSFDGTAALSFAGNSSNLTAVQQKFNSAATGTRSTLKPRTAYAMAAWVKVNPLPAAGVLRFALVDDNGTVINDSAGTPNSTSVTLSGASTSYASVTTVFRMPAVLPSSVYLRISLTTALSTGSTVCIDRVMMTETSEVYAGGPTLSIFSGPTPFLTGDVFSAAVTNTFGAFQKAFERNWGMATMGIVLPSDGAGTETIADSNLAIP